jgi:hypothetical protein
MMSAPITERTDTDILEALDFDPASPPPCECPHHEVFGEEIPAATHSCVILGRYKVFLCSPCTETTKNSYGVWVVVRPLPRR